MPLRGSPDDTSRGDPEWLYAFPRKWLFSLAAARSTLAPMERCCPVVELRQYTLRPGARDTLVGLFDEHFVESQERCGMRVIGHANREATYRE